MKGILTAAAAALMLAATAAGAQASRGVTDTAITSLRAKQAAKAKPAAARVTLEAGKTVPAAPAVVPRVRTARPDSVRPAARATGRTTPPAPARTARPARKKS